MSSTCTLTATVPSPTSSVRSYRMDSPQVIDGQYVDQRKLLTLLKNVYGTTNDGKNNFRVELRLNRYKIYPSTHIRGPIALTEDQIQDCKAYRRR